MGYNIRKYALVLALGVGVGVGGMIPAWADAQGPACIGNNLFEQMPAAELAMLRAQSDAVPYAQGLVWRATKAASEVLLVGTYHLHDQRHDATMAWLEPELARAGILMVETAPDAEAQLSATLQSDPTLVFDLDGPPLSKSLAPETWKTVASEIERRGIPSPTAAKMRPWYLSMILGFAPCSLEITAARGGPDGLDHMMMRKAEEIGLPIEGLEAWDTLFTLFGGLSPEENLLMLKSSVHAAGMADDVAVTTADAYFDGRGWDIWLLSAELMRKDDSLAPQQVEDQIRISKELLIDGRNKAWLAPVETAAAAAATEGKTAIVAVGLLHLPGESGLLNLMAQTGWEISKLY